MTPRSQRIVLIALLVVSAAIKIGMFMTVRQTDPQRIFHTDSGSYVRPALALWHIGRFSRTPEEPKNPEIVRTPGYPLMMTGVFRLFGENYTAIILLQIALSVMTLVLVYRLGSILWNTQVAILGVLLLSLDIPTVIVTQRLLTETLFTCIILLGILLLILSAGTPRYALFLAGTAGLCFGFATLIRPVAYYMPIPIVLGGIVMYRKSRRISWTRIFCYCGLLLLPYILLVGGWQYRNYRLTGKAEFSYIQGANFLFYRCAGIIAERDGISAAEARHQLGFRRYADVHPETTDWSIAQLDTRWKQEGAALIRQHPQIFLKSQFKGMLTMLIGPGEQSLLEYIDGNSASGGPLRDLFRLSFQKYLQTWVIERTGDVAMIGFSVGHLLLIYACLPISLWAILRTRDQSWAFHLVIWLVMLYFVAVSAGPGAYSRFRIPIMPFFSLYAGHGIFQIIRRKGCRDVQLNAPTIPT